MTNFSAKYPTTNLKKVIVVAFNTDQEAMQVVRKHFSQQGDDDDCHAGMVEEVKITFLGFKARDITKAKSTVDKCINEQIAKKGCFF